MTISRLSESPERIGSMIGYLDSSVILNNLLSQNPSSKIPLEEFEVTFSSTLLQVEAFRNIDRLRLQNQIEDREVASLVQILQKMLMKIGEIPVTESVLEWASKPFPTVIGTLDAIHVASALLWKQKEGQDIVFLTHDVQQGLAARALGLTTLGID